MAGELGATVIIQKEVTVPYPGPPIDRRHIGGRGYAWGSEDQSAFSTDTGETGDDSSDEQSTLSTLVRSPIDSAIDLGNSLGQARSSPQPIIRNFPYGQRPRIRSNDRLSSAETGSSSPRMSISRPDPDSDIDDDAAFAFDLDINSIAKSVTKLSSSASTDKTYFARTNHPPQSHPPKQKKTKTPYVPVDPAVKALQRRERRDARREQKRMELANASGILATVPVPIPIAKLPKPRIAVTKVEDPVDDATVIMDRQSDATAAPQEVAKAEAPIPFDPLAPRFIAEALVVRKFTLEESFLELDTLSFDP